ncbi:MAG: Queuine tRNA-ribosyltransferase [Parcubacteria group bacterium GW2011_GWC2_39_14]|nr:MAG: Queuine tRNA-ribosyltransferase [Parcubacteria group bacterium GW2011_GWC2_39_14]KKR54460.1 MAG: Queuine tRNA-ribosyltransferase [Parcubacteria group bacterium GW2011_GWA2_40_23]
MFKIVKQDKSSMARRGQLKTRKGIIETPFFMPIATKGGVKSITIEDMEKLQPGILLSNTYHLMLRPGEKEIKKLGGLHKFMNWDKPILTDSGGFQVFSLAKIRKLNKDGVVFRSHLDGSEYRLSPEDAIRIQMAIGSDIMMVLDECVELPAKREYLEKSIELTSYWAKRCKEYFESQSRKQENKKTKKQNRALLFGIVQGGLEKDLRKKSADDLMAIGFDGYAIGGLAVGETEAEMFGALKYVDELLPKDKPRYLMGVGYPHQIVEAVKNGVDMFDCVIPTREARHGRLYVWKKKTGLLKTKTKFYDTINVKAQKFQFDKKPINKNSQFPELRNHTRAYLRQLFVNEDQTAQRLVTLNNLEFYLDLMKQLRKEIK